jgi:FMN-dependent NADH-azoreductase
MKLLHIDSSILGDNSASRTLTREIVARWKQAVPNLEVQYLDLAAQELPHFSAQSLAQGSEAAARDARTLADFQAADILVIGAPMYNFGIPTQLKAWIDRILVAGKTFRYGPNGPEGLATGKRAVVAVTRGGVYPEAAAAEHAESYLKIALGFIGVTDVTFVRAEGLAFSPEHRQKGLDAAIAAARALAA